MKKSMLVLLFPCLTLSVIGQNLVGQNRQFMFPIPLDASQIDGTLLNDKEQFFSDMRFTVIASVTSKPVDKSAGTSGYVIMIGSFNPNKEKDSYFRYNVRDSGPVYFFITSDELNNMTEQIYPKWSPQFGAMTFPFKYRPQSGQFEPSFNLSATGGVKLDPTNLNNVTLLLLGGVGPSSVPVDATNSTATSATTAAAVSFSLSFVVQWKTVQLGLSCGMDNLLSPSTLKYDYQGRGWLSLGLGLTIFSTSSTTTASTTNSDTKNTKQSAANSPALQGRNKK